MKTLQHNEAAYTALAAYLRGQRLPHAILLEGPTGCGKRTFALEIAQGALCTGAGETRPCGECRDCMKVEKAVHPDILFYGEGEGGSRSFHIDQVRELRSQAYVRPNEGPCKVLILLDVQNMTVQAQNALLKIIEEPPANVIFILTCENKAALLETILSRVSAISLSLPTAEQCVDILRGEVPGLEDSRYREAAAQASGNVGQALSLLKQEDGRSLRAEALEIFAALCIGNETDALAALSRYERNRQGLAALLAQLKAIAVELLKGGGQTSQEMERLHNRLSPLQLMGIVAIMEELMEGLTGNVNGLLLVTAACSKCKALLSGS